VKNSNPKKWKANFRCALNSLADVKEINLRKSNKESKCVKIYQFVDDPNSKLKGGRGYVYFAIVIPFCHWC
jgi:interferon regulatory factor 1